MGKWKRLLRIILLCLLGAASLDGILVFLFFDGANMYSHLYYMRNHTEAEKDAIRIRDLESRIAEMRSAERTTQNRQVGSVRAGYAHLDTVLRNSDVLWRYPIPRKSLEGKFSADPPFRTDKGSLALCLRGQCFYEEGLPRYANLGWEPTGMVPTGIAAWARGDRGGQVTLAFDFILAKRSGPFELWEAYRRIGESTSLYYSNYLIHARARKLLRRGTELEREGSFLGESSASGRYVLIDQGCCPGVREISVLDASGLTLWDGSRIGKASWIGDTLAYYEPIPDGKALLPDSCTGRGSEPIPARLTYFRAGRIERSESRKVFCGTGPN